MNQNHKRESIYCEIQQFFLHFQDLIQVSGYFIRIYNLPYELPYESPPALSGGIDGSNFYPALAEFDIQNIVTG